jgi:hypothetical protein
MDMVFHTDSLGAAVRAAVFMDADEAAALLARVLVRLLPEEGKQALALDEAQVAD